MAEAISTGDHAVWERDLAPEFLYAEENQKIMNREQFLKELTPLPKGVTGEIKITTFEAHVQGDAAVVAYREDEFEHYFGNEVRAQYLVTETWLRLNGQWKLRATHVSSIPVDPPEVPLTHTQIDELTGTYRAGTLTTTIRRDGDRILSLREGRPETELKAEARDVLFVPGQPRSIKVFQRDASGKVTGYADRRENRDIQWVRAK